jgi:hypothetical protein
MRRRKMAQKMGLFPNELSELFKIDFDFLHLEWIEKTKETFPGAVVIKCIIE